MREIIDIVLKIPNQEWKSVKFSGFETIINEIKFCIFATSIKGYVCLHTKKPEDLNFNSEAYPEILKRYNELCEYHSEKEAKYKGMLTLQLLKK